MSNRSPTRTPGWWCFLLLAANAIGISQATAGGHVAHRTVSSQLTNALRITPTQSPHLLRVLMLGDYTAPAHRAAALEFSILADYARANHRELAWIPVFRPEELYEKLLSGEGDIALGSLPAELASRATIATTHPLSSQRYQIFGRTENPARNPLELAGMHLGIRLSSPLWSYFERLQAIVPGLSLEALPGNLDRDTALQMVAEGKYDATVIPTAVEDDGVATFPRLKRLFDLTDGEPVGWYVRSDHRSLVAGLNRFIERYHTAYFEPIRAPRNFASIQQRGVLRIITRVDPRNYFIDAGGGPSGYEFELASAFANAHRLKLQVLVADNDQQLVNWLKDGAGDIVTTRIDGKTVYGDPGVAFSRRYHHTAYAIVTRQGHAIHTLEALQNKWLVAPAGSPELRAARAAAARIPGMRVVEAASEVSFEQMLKRLAQGEVDAAVIDGETAATLVAKRRELTVGISLPTEYEYRWLVHGNDRTLLEAIDHFLVESHRQGLDSVIANRYFDHPLNFRIAAPDRTRISPYDRLLKTYAERYDFDWRLIAAQAYQESQFNPRAVSSTGAQGLMQILPSTAKELGFINVNEPESAIHAGVKYLYTLRGEFADDVPISERTWFALAAYNTGFDRIARARRLAAKLKLDPNKWFGNVETAMLKFAQPGNGARPDRSCGQAIVYVREIMSLYGAYRHLSSTLTPAAINSSWASPLSSVEGIHNAYLMATNP